MQRKDCLPKLCGLITAAFIAGAMCFGSGCRMMEGLGTDVAEASRFTQKGLPQLLGLTTQSQGV